MLLCQQGGGHQHDDLLAGLHGDERGAQGDLGLAEADIAADHAVHRTAAAEIGDDGFDGLRLVRCFLELERRFEGAQITFIRSKLFALARGTARIEIEQLRCGVANALRCLLLCLLPGIEPSLCNGAVSAGEPV